MTDQSDRSAAAMAIHLADRADSEAGAMLAQAMFDEMADSQVSRPTALLALATCAASVAAQFADDQSDEQIGALLLDACKLIMAIYIESGPEALAQIEG